MCEQYVVHNTVAGCGMSIHFVSVQSVSGWFSIFMCRKKITCCVPFQNQVPSSGRHMYKMNKANRSVHMYSVTEFVLLIFESQKGLGFLFLFLFFLVIYESR